MSINPYFEDKKENQITETIFNFDKDHKEDLEAILQVLMKITSRTPQEIKPHLDAMLKRLIESEKERATPKARSRAFRKWVESHTELNAPLLSDEAISRESIYGERG